MEARAARLATQWQGVGRNHRVPHHGRARGPIHGHALWRQDDGGGCTCYPDEGYDNEYDDHPPERYRVSDDEIRDLQTRLRDRRAPGRRALADQLRWGIGHIRYELAQGPSITSRFRSDFSIYESIDEWLARNGTGQAHEFRIKLDALYRLLTHIWLHATN